MNPNDAQFNALDLHALDQKSWSFQDIIGQAQGRFPSALRDFISVKDPQFGAKGDGVTDDTAAIQAAITSLGTKGGTILFPGNAGNVLTIYQCAGSLNLDDTVGIVLCGQGSISGGGNSSAFLRFSGTGTCISARSTSGFVCRQLGMQVTNAANVGYFIDLDHSSGGSDSQEWLIERCGFFGGSADASMPGLINTNRAIIGKIRECTFNGGSIAILGRETNSAYYTNVVQILSNLFLNIKTVPIRNPGQAWLIQGNTFEQLSSGNVGAIDFQNAVPFSATGLSIIGNWCGDGNATGTWFSLFGDGILVAGNYISTGATGVSTPGTSGLSGCTITGNHFDTVTTAVDFAFTGCANIAHFGNFYNSVTTQVANAGNITSGFYSSVNGVQNHVGRLNNSQGAVVASANNLVLGTDGNYFQISGNTQINLLANTNWQGGSEVTLKFNSTPTVKHNQATSGANVKIILNGAVDFVAAASNTLTLRYDSTDVAWYEQSRKV